MQGDGGLWFVFEGAHRRSDKGRWTLQALRAFCLRAVTGAVLAILRSDGTPPEAWYARMPSQHGRWISGVRQQ